MSGRRSYESVREEELDGLIMWSDNTVGYHHEADLIRLLNHLCRQFGYGRVPQLAREIEEVWRNPEKADEFRVRRKNRLDELAEMKKRLDEHSTASE